MLQLASLESLLMQVCRRI